MEIKITEFNSTLDPFDIYTLFKDERNTAFLDSARDAATLGRYSFIGVNPFLVLKEEEGKCYVNGTQVQIDSFDMLDQLLQKFRVDFRCDIPFPAGCIGYISYDAGLRLDKVRITSKKGFDIPDIYFVFYDNIIAFDNLTGKRYISAFGRLCSHDESICRIIDRIRAHEENPDINHEEKPVLKEIQASEPNDDPFSGFVSNFTREDYEAAITRMKEYIRSGDIYIANMTQRFSRTSDFDAFSMYRKLRRINPAPFAAYLPYDGFEIISCSPERFMRIEDRMVETRPIKGTRPRGKTPQEDEANKQQLINSEKDKAELLMIVDLERNDLSKVCKPGTVKVTELFKLEEYSTVFHLVSTVIGELKEGVTPLRCIMACFPGGSITGTPKLRAMEIIDELEGIRRSLYTGCIGYFSFNGNADFNIVIRTLIKKGSDACLGVGGGITWDSVEADEYMETIDKAGAFFRAFRM